LKETVVDFASNKINYTKLKVQGKCSFYKKNYYHAKKCFELLNEGKKISSVESNMLAYIYSRHNKKEESILALCKTLELKKNDKIASRVLNYIKFKGRDLNLSEDTFFDALIPIEPVFISFSKIFFSLFIVFIVFFTIFFGGYFFKKQKFPFTKNYRKELSKIRLNDYNPNLLGSPKSETKTDKYSYNENEVKVIFAKVKKEIINKKYNSAQIYSNKLKMSNASLSVKGKIGILESFIDEPEYATFKNEIDYVKVKDNPKLYDNVFIRWSGRVVNYVYNDSTIKFRLVIGDESQGVILGIVPVVFDKAVVVSNNDLVELFAKVSYSANGFVLNGRYILQK